MDVHKDSIMYSHKLPLADSIVYATALVAGAAVWTQDQDFDGLPDVRYFPRQPEE